MNAEAVNPKVSVIVMTYNQEKTIARTLDSVIGQEGDVPFEVIIGEDASTDGTRAVCEDYCRRYPDIVRLMPGAPNKGPVDNYFDCLLEAKGQYISDCSGDDFWSGTRKLILETTVLDENPDAVVAYSDWRIVDADGESVLASTLESSRRIAADVRPMIVKVLDHTDALPYLLSASTYRRDAVMEVYNDSPDMVRNVLFGCEDVSVMAALASRGKAVRVPVPTFTYVSGAETVSRSKEMTKEAKFYVKSLYASRVLAEYYGVPLGELYGVYLSKLKFISSAAFRSGDAELLKAVDKIIASWPLRPDIKTRLRHRLSKSPLFALSRRLYNLRK